MGGNGAGKTTLTSTGSVQGSKLFHITEPTEGYAKIHGPVGVQTRNPSTGSGHRYSNARIHSLGWEAKVSLKKGIGCTYPRIEAQVKVARSAE
jgi:nucleoside-diphosphate-sugar epimerase